MPGLINKTLLKDFEAEVRFLKATSHSINSPFTKRLIKRQISEVDKLICRYENLQTYRTGKNLREINNSLDAINECIIMSMLPPAAAIEWDLGTQLTRFPFEVLSKLPFHVLESITTINLSDNRYLKMLDDEFFRYFRNVTTLFLDSTAIQSLPDTLLRLPLTSLYMTQTKIELTEHQRTTLVQKGCILHEDLYIHPRGQAFTMV